MDNYIGEIRPFAFGFVPTGWHICDGTLLPLQKYQALYALIGTSYGGDGRTNFALPDLRGRCIVGANNANVNYKLGTKAGAETVALLTNNIPAHRHEMEVANLPGAAGIPTNRIAIPTSPDGTVTAKLFSTDTSNTTTLGPAMLDSAGGNIAHANMQPFLVINYCIALIGNWPSRP